jgi:hypothetical protein
MATQTIISERSQRVTHGPIQDGPSAQEVALYLDPDQMRRPEYTVYLHSISKRSFEQPHPIFRNVIIPACPKEKRYITFMRINHPVQIPTVNPDNVSGPPIIRIENAKRAALCVCNPSYVSSDLSAQDNPPPDWAQIASGECNLTRQGVFASMNEVPTEDELKKAEDRRLAYYKFRFEEANGLLRSDPKKLQEVLSLDHHMAAEMFGQDVDWHRVTTPKIECPNCGEKIKEGIAFHYSNGARCVLDWERAYLAGAVKKEDVPEQFIWWKDEVKRKTGIASAAAQIKSDV